ncbi:hypothetical protein GO755_39585 [Spirosoma sp. HMF4905]|uniref:Uncharacterized protein n=1 Tax=Spirosoma arboris TaxID=2682092 RepID=A0A7K1SQV6_9BACT|nr:hypothetical protein [Spirosoma arboris]MVM36181.1 hypothetical protein [Spirosoma arboris]
MRHFSRLFIGLMLVISLDQCKQPSIPVPADTTSTRDDNMAMGNPDGAKASESSLNSHLITRSIYRFLIIVHFQLKVKRGPRCRYDEMISD